MISKRSILAISASASLVAHGILLAASPNLHIMASALPPETVLKPFRVRLVQDADTRRPDTRLENGSGALGSEPGSIDELLNRMTERLSPGNSGESAPVEVPDLANRLAREPMQPLSEQQSADAVMQQMDAKILEISQDIARREIQIERRLVAPSPDRILEKDELPTLRSSTAAIADEVIVFNPDQGTGALGAGGAVASGAPSQGAGAALPVEAPAREPGVMADVAHRPAERTLPELPVERVIARAPVVSDIQKKNTRKPLDDVVNLDLQTFVPPGEREGFFRLQIAPKDGQNIAPLAKDVTFIIDASNSITQRKLDETVKGVRKMVADLRPDDRFNVVIFRDTPTLFQARLVPASDETKKAAAQFLTGVVSKGETDVYQGILPVVTEQPRPGVPGIVLVMSDGRPTSGIKDSRTIINSLTDENALRQTIFAFGGGKTVDQKLLDLLAYRNKGEASVVPQIESIGSELPRFFSRLSDPILVNCVADFGGLDGNNIFPKQIPDFYKGQAVTIYGRFDPSNNRLFAMRLTGTAGSDEKEVVFQADLTEAKRGDQEIARNWAFQRVYWLIGEMTRVGETPELLAELRSLAKQYNIRTSYD
ncbi:MAG: VWA domain-containing protein [Candidatus Hydrogenedentes bacterium]|nr:VWA domain-containing protein [Candidatus Hydrogenedentota bacterium]